LMTPRTSGVFASLASPLWHQRRKVLTRRFIRFTVSS